MERGGEPKQDGHEKEEVLSPCLKRVRDLAIGS